MKLLGIKRVSLFVLLIILGQQMAGAAPAKTIDLFPICVGKKYGYVDSSGQIVIKPQFRYADEFSEGYAVIIDVNGNYGFLSSAGEMHIFNGAKNLKKYKCGLAPIRYDEWGYVDKNFIMVIAPQFSEADEFSEGFARIGFTSKNDKRTRVNFITTQGTFIFQSSFQTASSFSEGMAMVRNGDKAGFVNTKGELAINYTFESAQAFSDGLAAVQIKRNGIAVWGYIDKTGAIMISPAFSSAMPFQEGYAAVCTNGRYGLIDKSGNFVIQPKYERLSSPKESVVRFCDNDKWGYMYIDGRLLHEAFFDEADEFHNGFAPVSIYKTVNGVNEPYDGLLKFDGSVIWGNELK